MIEEFGHSATARACIEARLGAFRSQPRVPGNLRSAAVVIAICRWRDEAAVILTRRASLRAHGRQWALPGGRLDPGETVLQAALRELREEINLYADDASVIGVLDDYPTRSGYNITPIVVWSDCEWTSLAPNPDEVDFIEPFRFSELLRPDSPVLSANASGDHPVLSIHFGDDVVFAPTGAILYQFREVALLGRHTRVAHFDQPEFAWR